jgi:GH35 family endo-1,4-beta-xylanase
MKKFYPKTVLTFLILFVAFFAALAVVNAQVPEGGTMMNATSGTTWQKVGKGTVTEIDVDGQPFTKGLRAVTGTDVVNYWDAQIQFPTVTGIAADDIVLVAFYARTISSVDETGEGSVTIVIENSTTWAKELSVRISIGSEWKEYYASAKCVSTLSPTGVRYAFQTGYRSQTIEVADVRFLNYKNTLTLEDLPVTEITYAGQDADAAWRVPAQERIEQIRKGQAELSFFDGHGNQIMDAEIKIEMVRNSFGFGTAIPASVFIENDVFRNKVYELFNEVVFENDLKWPQFNPNSTHLKRALDSLNNRNIPVRGHNIIWPSWGQVPESLQSLEDDPEALRKAIEKRIDDVTRFTRGRLNDWDVINEPWSENDIMKILGDEVMADWFKRVRANDPDVKLYLNDYGIISGGGLNQAKQDFYYNLVQFIDELGGGVDGIGIQGHFSSDLTSIEKVYSIIDRFAELGKDIKITEHDINTTQREVQADYTRDLMTILYSHPAVKSFMYWGFWENSHWRPDGALYNADWSIRPHGEVYRDLVLNQWRTPDQETSTGPSGEVSFEGFLGTYRYTIKTLSGEHSGTFEITNSFQSGLSNEITITLDAHAQGFFIDDWTPKSIEITEFEEIPQTMEEATVTVSVKADSVITRVSPFVYGHNAAAWGGKLNESTRAVENIRNLSPNVMRWPGGSMSNSYFWAARNKATMPDDLPPIDPNDPNDPNKDQYRELHFGSNNNSWTMSIDHYYDLLKKTGSEGSISVNYSYARYGTSEDPVLAAAKYAADWVRYDNGRTRFWEIGNENYGGWERGYRIDQSLNKDGQPQLISGELYGKHARVFIEEMRKAARETGHEIKIGVVTRNEHVNYTDDVMNNWNRGMMSQVGDMADFFIPHTYFTPWQQNSGVDVILNSETKVKSIRNYIDGGLKNHAGLDPGPIAMTEWNIFAEGRMQQVSFINGMHAALVLGEAIKNQYGMAIRWDLMNGWSDGDNHGILADGEPGIPKYTPRAPFFHMYYFQKFFGDRMVHSGVQGSTSVVSYASRFNSGQTGIVLVNKGTAGQVVTMNMENFSTGDRYYYYVLTGGDDNGDFSRKVYVNGLTTSYDGGGPDNYTEIMPYGTAIEGDIRLELPGRGTLFVLIEQDATLQGQTIEFDPLPVKMVGDSDFRLHATASSGMQVKFASTDPQVAVVRHDRVEIIGAGTVEIIAYQEGDAATASVQVSRTLTVEKAGQSISMEPFDETAYGAEFPGDPATVTSGLPARYTSSNHDVAVIQDGKIVIIGAGTTEITAHQDGNRNFNPAEPVSQSLTVSPGSQSIIMEPSAEITFGDTWPGDPATATSGLPVSYASSNHEVATVSDDIIVVAGAGITEITAYQDGNDNWHPATPVIMTLTVLKSGQTITFPELPEKMTNDPDFPAGATASSGLECSYESSETTVATVEDGIIIIKGAGTALITARQEGDKNYLAAAEVTRELIVSSPTGIDEPPAGNFSIYPNPASDYITVRLHQRESEITIHNASGAIVYRNTVSVPELIIPVWQMGGAGTYVIIVNSVSAKFIVAE